MYDSTNQYEVQILTGNSNVMTEYTHLDNPDIKAVEARDKSQFKIKCVNHSNRRALFVPSIDGLSTVDRQPAGLKSSGYIVPPKSFVVIDGYRENDYSVADFVFTLNKGETLTHQSQADTASNGVIGFLVFKEEVKRQPPAIASPVFGGWGKVVDWPNGELPPRREYTTCPSSYGGESTPLGTSSMRAISSDAGTGAGNSSYSNTHLGNFDKENPSSPDGIITIYYASLTNLRKQRFNVDNYTSLPNPFPGWSEYSKINDRYRIKTYSKT